MHHHCTWRRASKWNRKSTDKQKWARCRTEYIRSVYYQRCTKMEVCISCCIVSHIHSLSLAHTHPHTHTCIHNLQPHRFYNILLSSLSDYSSNSTMLSKRLTAQGANVRDYLIRSVWEMSSLWNILYISMKLYMHGIILIYNPWEKNTSIYTQYSHITTVQVRSYATSERHLFN